MRTRSISVLLLATGIVASCSDPAMSPAEPDAAAADIRHESNAPLCSDITSPQAPNALFTHQLVDADEVSTTVVLGDMDPTSPQEILNFELGFYVPSSNVPLLSPADLYVESIERSYHASDDVTDYGIGYHVCSYLDGDTRKGAVTGNFAHVSALGSTLDELFEAELQKFESGQASAMDCSGSANEECTLNMNRMREHLGDPDYVFVVEAGTDLGLAGPNPGKTGPSGIDANLIDARQNDFAGNYYINPTRLGAEGGPGAAWRYGACTYDYFVEPYRTQYLAKIVNVGEPRVSMDQPCGTMEIDKNAEGTLGGLWALPEIENATMQASFGGAELDAYLANLLVLADHLSAPATKMMLSTYLDTLSNITGEPSVIEFDKAVENDSNWNKQVNVPFKLAQPGLTYCYVGKRLGGNQDAYYLADISQDGSVMQIEKVGEDCTDLAPASRSFDTGSPAYFSFGR